MEIKHERILSQEEKERTKRQKLIQGWDQEVIKNSTVFIAGVGALGCEVGKDLALSGIGKLILCDMDRIETSNLSRQMLFYKGDEGRFKADVGAERLKLMNPFMEIEIFTIPLQQIPMDKYKECQIVIAALDNVQARMDLNKFCLKLGIPLIEAGTVGFDGHVQVIIPENAKDVSGKPLSFGNQDKIIEDLANEYLWNLDEDNEEFGEFFGAQKAIEALEQQIENIKMNNINPVLEKLKLRAKKEVETNYIKYEKYLQSTPCYRCVVPIPPPLQNQVAACTLKGVPRTREHCAIRGEVMFIKKYDRQPDYDNIEEMKETLEYAKKELDQLRARVLDENIPPEMKGKIEENELIILKKNIFETFGGEFALEDMENILGNKIPAIQSVSSIIASIQSQEATKLLFLLAGTSVGPIMNPPYLNYSGIYGLFDQIPISRSEDCVGCGSRQGQENITVVVPIDATVGELFKAIREINKKINDVNWIITNPLTKQFIFNPLFERGRTQHRKLTDFNLKNLDEVVLTTFGKEQGESEIKQFNIIVQMI
ncbi:ThiF family adenylyltransferase [Promethearchaeum syntrophicum]|uniref:ThiF family adenylyltransferase n=1 Tax=Promethearchaeum syntrophicum TaxID=2594042 RepID=A0A5B9DAB7_9ARCH|nr:ThiF family adenylyltransferase [Candidatus Prometheoarchaeum syntrophicum]QEE16179.1 putative adenylyltransferase [Candidatus Prometheoarchaeum syntrophicum]